MTNSEEELAITRKELESLRKEFQEFTYAVSHDLSAPFRHINGFLDIISKDKIDRFDEDTKTYFDYIIQASQEGTTLLAGLVEFSRLETNITDFTQVDMNQSFDDAIFQLGQLIKETSAKIQTPTLPSITANQQQISQLFYHLLKNALLYQSDKEAPMISINYEDRNEELQFCVKDNGIGILPHQLEQIFKPLRRAAGNEYPGIGMGLAITKKILAKLGGKIWVELSEEGSGSKFYFTLPKHPTLLPT